MGSFHIPLDGLHADGADGGDDVVVVLPIGAADEALEEIWSQANDAPGGEVMG